MTRQGLGLDKWLLIKRLIIIIEYDLEKPGVIYLFATYGEKIGLGMELKIVLVLL